MELLDLMNYCKSFNIVMRGEEEIVISSEDLNTDLRIKSYKSDIIHSKVKEVYSRDNIVHVRIGYDKMLYRLLTTNHN